MTKMLVINSFGPMASTLLSGLMEKFGYMNVPIRKYGLHQYLTGQLSLECGYMQERLKAILQDHSIAGLRGGVSVLDRDNQQPKALVDYERVKDRIDGIRADNVQDLYIQCRDIYYDAVTYKDISTHRDWHIEMTTDIHRYDHKALYDAYQAHFDEVKMIHLHRPFGGWMNSLASQAFVHPELKQRLMFFPHLRYADYALYEEAVAAMPGMHIQFDEMFDTPIEQLAAQISAFIDVDVPECDFRQEDYDMYGKIVPYEKAFTRFDDGQVFLSDKTKRVFCALAENKTLKSFPFNAYGWALYFIDMIHYRRG
jgi:hypothetical protein